MIYFFGLFIDLCIHVNLVSTAIYVLLLPISFFHFQKIKKQHENDKIQDEDDLEDVL